MKFKVTSRIKTHATKEQILDILEEQFSTVSESVSQNGQVITAKSIEASFGSINRNDTTDISLRSSDRGGYVMMADVKYSPSVWFWIILIITIWTGIFWIIPIAFYLIQKKTVKESIEDCFKNTANELESETQTATSIPNSAPSQNLISDFERLGNLVQQGMVSQEEFNSYKANVLGILAPQIASPPPLPTPKISPNGVESDADRMFELAKGQLANGDKQIAINTLQSLIRQYPNSDAAERAQRMLTPKRKVSE